MLRTLVDRARLGDEEAFDALARMVGDRCMAIACGILRDPDPAEDAVQAALITAWRELRTLRDPDRFEPWPWASMHVVLQMHSMGYQAWYVMESTRCIRSSS